MNYLVDEIPPERIIGKIIEKNAAQLYLDVEVTNITLVLLDSIDINIGDSIRICFDEIVRV